MTLATESRRSYLARQLNDKYSKLKPLVIGKPVSEVLDAFWTWLQTQENADSYLKEKHYKIERYRRTWGYLGILSLTRKNVVGWLNDHVASYDSYRQHRILLRSLFAFSLSQGWIESNPMNDTIVLPAKRERQRRRLTIEEFRQLHASLNRGCRLQWSSPC